MFINFEFIIYNEHRYQSRMVNDPGDPNKFQAPGAIGYDARLLSHLPGERVSIQTMDGRICIPYFCINPEQNSKCRNCGLKINTALNVAKNLGTPLAAQNQPQKSKSYSCAAHYQV